MVALPYTTLVQDHRGAWYGLTTGGGNQGCNGGNGCGTVFMLTHNSSGHWVHTVLYRFKGQHDGWAPQGALVFDAEDNLFGATSLGGRNSACTYVLGCGTIFELQRNEKKPWTKMTLYNFAGGTDGQGPNNPLIWDGRNKLYGSTYFGGVDSCYAGVGCGTVFELKRTREGRWAERVLYRFTGSADGMFAQGISRNAGSLYGFTESGGGSGCYGLGCGTVFELTPSSPGVWVESILYSFTGATDGAFLNAGLLFDGKGNLYGTAMQGGDQNCTVRGGYGGCGTVFTVGHSGNTWTQSVLYAFSGGADGIIPEAPITWHDGNLYGMTSEGGGDGCYAGYGCGTVFELKQSRTGWQESILYTFDGHDGELPLRGGVSFDQRGDLLGTTSNGGSYTAGNVFKLRLQAPSPKSNSTLRETPAVP